MATQTRRVALAACLSALWAIVIGAAETKPEFAAQPIDGEAVSGRLLGIAKGWRITLEGVEQLHGSEVISLRRKDASPVAAPSGAQILLAGGDRVRAIAQRATEEVLVVNSELAGEIEIPLERIQAILINPPADAAEREQLCQQLLAESRKHDVVTLANGDEFEGSFLELDDRQLKFERQGQAVEINRSEIRSLAFSSDLIAAPKLTQLYAKAFLADGSEISITDAWTESGNLNALAAFGGEIATPLEQLTALEFRNGRITYLSDIEPAEFRHASYLGVKFDLQRDRSVLGNPILLRGQLFRKGLGVHSRSEVSYALADYHRRFEATVGIDDETMGQGSVIFRVLLDDKLVWESKSLTGRSAPVLVRVDLAGAKKLTLLVDFAELGDVQDHADWADARVVR